jgi:hypothetical protein
MSQIEKRKEKEIDKTIFILPFRNRYTELQIWLKHMLPILDQQFNCKEMSYENKPYEVLVIHQADNKLFNKGALVNIGFQIIKEKYNDNNEIYKSFTLVMNDIDIVPTKVGIFDYKTVECMARHPYGVLRPQFGGILGGIYYIKFSDYERINGIPNYWGWGGEDICTARRALAHGIKINEDNFIERRSTHDILDPESAPTEKQKRFQSVTDIRNLKECFCENHLKPTNGINNCKYEIISHYGVVNYENISNVRMYDVRITIV